MDCLSIKSYQVRAYLATYFATITNGYAFKLKRCDKRKKNTNKNITLKKDN